MKDSNKQESRREFGKKVLTLAVGGMFAGAALTGRKVFAEEEKKDAAKHGCKGANACKGQGGDGKNECKGKGACATAKHECKTKNECKGQGGGKEPGKNECKGKGDCAAPPKKD